PAPLTIWSTVAVRSYACEPAVPTSCWPTAPASAAGDVCAPAAGATTAAVNAATRATVVASRLILSLIANLLSGPSSSAGRSLVPPGPTTATRPARRQTADRARRPNVNPLLTDEPPPRRASRSGDAAPQRRAPSRRHKRAETASPREGDAQRDRPSIQVLSESGPGERRRAAAARQVASREWRPTPPPASRRPSWPLA